MTGYVKDYHLYFTTFILLTLTIHLTVGLITERTQYFIFNKINK